MATREQDILDRLQRIRELQRRIREVRTEREGGVERLPAGQANLLERALVASGAREEEDPEAAALQRIAETAGRGADAASVLARVPFPGAPPYEERRATSQRRLAALEDFLRQTPRSLPFVGQFTDELAGAAAAAVPGGRGYEEARDIARQAAEDRELTSPLATTLAEIAGGVAIPGIVGARTGSIGMAALKGGGIGAAEGLAYGAGKAEGGVGERLKAGVVPGIVGAGVGAASGALAAKAAAMMKRRVAGRGARLSRELKESTGLPGYTDFKDWADQSKKTIRKTFYQPFEEGFPEVRDPALRTLLASDELQPAVERVAGKGGFPLERGPSFEDVQAVRESIRGLRDVADRAGDRFLKNRYQDLEEELTQQMQRVFPGLDEADELWALVSDANRAFDMGAELANRAPEEIERARGAFRSDVAQEAFRAGQLHKITTSLERRDRAALKWLKDFMDMGPGSERTLRSLFPDTDAGEAAFNEFRRTLGMEQSAELMPKLRNLLRDSRMGVYKAIP